MENLIFFSIGREELKSLLAEAVQNAIAVNSPPQPDVEQLIGKDEVKQLLNYKSDSAFWQLRKETDFPAPVNGMTKRNLKWRKSDITTWIKKVK